MNYSFIWKQEDADYEYQLSCMIDQYSRFLQYCNLYQNSLYPLLRFCHIDLSISTDWFLERRSSWKENYDLNIWLVNGLFGFDSLLEVRMWNSLPFLLRTIIGSALSRVAWIGSKWLLIGCFSSLLSAVFLLQWPGAWQRKRLADQFYRTFKVCGVLGTDFSAGGHQGPYRHYRKRQTFYAISLPSGRSIGFMASVIDLVNTKAVCLDAESSSYDIATLLIAWHFMKCVDWDADSSISTSQFLPFFMKTDSVSVFFAETSARGIQNARDFFVPQPRFTEDLFLRPMPSWSSLRWQGVENIYIAVMWFLCTHTFLIYLSSFRIRWQRRRSSKLLFLLPVPTRRLMRFSMGHLCQRGSFCFHKPYLLLSIPCLLHPILLLLFSLLLTWLVQFFHHWSRPRKFRTPQILPIRLCMLLSLRPLLSLSRVVKTFLSLARSTRIQDHLFFLEQGKLMQVVQPTLLSVAQARPSILFRLLLLLFVVLILLQLLGLAEFLPVFLAHCHPRPLFLREASEPVLLEVRHFGAPCSISGIVFHIVMPYLSSYTRSVFSKRRSLRCW